MRAKNIHNTLAKICWWQSKNEYTVMMQFKMNFRIGESDALKFVDDVAHLHGVCFEKVSSRRNIKE